MMLLVRASAGMILWAFGFSLLYAQHGLGCVHGWSGMPLMGGTLFRLVLVVTWLILGCGGIAIIRWTGTMPPGFERRLAVACSVAGFFGTLVTGAPVIVSSSCNHDPQTFIQIRG